MIQPVQRQPAYVLHRRAYKETSAILELLTLEHGRIAGVVRGPRARSIEPFSRLEVAWRGRGQLVTITAYEVAHQWRLSGRFLFSGLYLNELLMRTLKPEEPVTDLFKVYEESLGRLDVQHEMESTLRVFEKCLLRELGYELAFDEEAVTGEEIKVDGHYEYCVGAGFQVVCTGTPGSYAGSTLQAIAMDRYDTEAVRQAAKVILRQALKPLLGDRPMATRELFQRRR